MREAINNNPIVQVAVLGGLLLAVGLFMMFGMKKGSSDSASTAASSTAAPATSSTPPASSTSAAGGTGVTAGSTGSAGAVTPPTTGSVSPEALIPGPGLPRPFITAWKRGDTVVLLVVRPHGIDDRLVRRSVRSLSDDRGVSVFVTRADKVARYSRITQSVGVSQAPALVVVRPKSVSGSVPEAQVSYGFRDSQGVVQAVHDAVYSGKDNLPYSPR
jgi:hypothetical protein